MILDSLNEYKSPVIHTEDTMTAGAPTWSSDAVLRRLRGTGEGLIRSTGPGAAADRAMGRALTGFLDRIAGRGSG